MAANLPPDSAVRRATDPDWWITPELLMLRELEHGVRVLAWQQTQDGRQSNPQHYPLRIDFRANPTPSDGPDLMTRDEMAAALGWDKKEVAQ